MDSIIDPRKPKDLARSLDIEIYLSGTDGGGYGKSYFPWPYRMGRPNEVNNYHVNDCDKYILDSGIHIDEIKNQDVIDQALKINPDYVVVADVLHNPEKTTNRVIEFLDLIDDSGLKSGVIIPLQPSKEGNIDHYKHFYELEKFGDYFAIGGVMNQGDKVKRKSVELFRENIGFDVKLHGFAFNLTYFLDKEVIKNPLLDSIDSSAPIQAGKNGKSWILQNNTVKEIKYPKPKGSMSLLQISLQSGLTLVTTSRLILNNMDEICFEKSNDSKKKLVNEISEILKIDSDYPPTRSWLQDCAKSIVENNIHEKI